MGLTESTDRLDRDMQDVSQNVKALTQAIERLLSQGGQLGPGGAGISVGGPTPSSPAGSAAGPGSFWSSVAGDPLGGDKPRAAGPGPLQSFLSAATGSPMQGLTSMGMSALSGAAFNPYAAAGVAASGLLAGVREEFHPAAVKFESRIESLATDDPFMSNDFVNRRAQLRSRI